jgi:predicted Zn-ribbon and HTH transcriptional regulator
MATSRQRIIELLSSGPQTVRDLATLLRQKARDVEADLKHVKQTLGKRLRVHPAYCDACGRAIERTGDRFGAPSRCPYCKSERTSPPLLELVNER